MALISMRQLLDNAAEYKYGVPAFNFNNLEQIRAIMEAADTTDSPVIVQASAGARKYAGAPFLRHLILAAIEEFPHIPVCMHQDHGTSPAICQRSIQLGFSSEQSKLIASQVVKGASQLIAQTGHHPEFEIDRVSTPKGCTIEGLNEMEHNGFSSALIKGVVKSKQLFD